MTNNDRSTTAGAANDGRKTLEAPVDVPILIPSPPTIPSTPPMTTVFTGLMSGGDERKSGASSLSLQSTQAASDGSSSSSLSLQSHHSSCLDNSPSSSAISISSNPPSPNLPVSSQSHTQPSSANTGNVVESREGIVTKPEGIPQNIAAPNPDSQIIRSSSPTQANLPTNGTPTTSASSHLLTEQNGNNNSSRNNKVKNNTNAESDTTTNKIQPNQNQYYSHTHTSRHNHHHRTRSTNDIPRSIGGITPSMGGMGGAYQQPILPQQQQQQQRQQPMPSVGYPRAASPTPPPYPTLAVASYPMDDPSPDVGVPGLHPASWAQSGGSMLPGYNRQPAPAYLQPNPSLSSQWQQSYRGMPYPQQHHHHHQQQQQQQQSSDQQQHQQQPSLLLPGERPRIVQRQLSERGTGRVMGPMTGGGGRGGGGGKGAGTNTSSSHHYLQPQKGSMTPRLGGVAGVAGKGRHRKTHSMGDELRSYNLYTNDEGEDRRLLPLAPLFGPGQAAPRTPYASPSLAGTSRKHTFDPRSDWLSFTNTFARSPGNPIPTHQRTPTAASLSPIQMNVNQNSMFPFPNHGNSIGSNQSRTSSVHSAAVTAGGYHRIHSNPPVQQQQEPLGFVGQHQTKRLNKPESLRRKHMRQHSAQMHMETVKGVEQSHKCRDVIFLLLFAFHLFGIIYLSNLYSDEAFQVHYDEAKHAQKHGMITVYYTPLLYLSCISGAFAIALSCLLLGIMSVYPSHFIQVALVVVITLSFVWGTIGIGLSPKNVVPITGIISLAFTVGYAFIVWDRIPFASANLNTALSAIRAYPGTVLFAVCAQILTMGWCIFFSIVVIGMYDTIRAGKLQVSHAFATVIYVLLGLSFYWTYQVLQNTVQAVTAGVIGKWWYNQDTDHAVRKSVFRSIFYSMGSICFGSLVLGPVRLVSMLYYPAGTDENSLVSVHQCIYCIQSHFSKVINGLNNRFNSWAFTYIGMCGYGFMDASARATETIQVRGWARIASDDLVPNVLLLSSVVLGGVTGCFCQLMEQVEPLRILSVDKPISVAFAIGVINGVVLSSVLFSVIGSAVHSVLICFAISPVDFDQNHSDLSDDMRKAWSEVWPGALDVVDLRIPPSMAAAAASSPAVGPILGPHHPLSPHHHHPWNNNTLQSLSPRNHPLSHASYGSFSANIKSHNSNSFRHNKKMNERSGAAAATTTAAKRAGGTEDLQSLFVPLAV